MNKSLRKLFSNFKILPITDNHKIFPEFNITLDSITKNFYLCGYVEQEKQEFSENHFGIFHRDVCFCGFVFFRIT